VVVFTTERSELQYFTNICVVTFAVQSIYIKIWKKNNSQGCKICSWYENIQSQLKLNLT